MKKLSLLLGIIGLGAASSALADTITFTSPQNNPGGNAITIESFSFESQAQVTGAISISNSSTALDIPVNDSTGNSVPIDALKNWGFNVTATGTSWPDYTWSFTPQYLIAAVTGNITFKYINTDYKCSGIALAEGYSAPYHNWYFFGSSNSYIMTYSENLFYPSANITTSCTNQANGSSNQFTIEQYFNYGAPVAQNSQFAISPQQ